MQGGISDIVEIKNGKASVDLDMDFYVGDGSDEIAKTHCRV